MKNSDSICPILLIRLTHFYTFLSKTSIVLITASKKAVMFIITHSKKLKLNIES